jgi:N-acyl-D-amino-acid deacylase
MRHNEKRTHMNVQVLLQRGWSTPGIRPRAAGIRTSASTAIAVLMACMPLATTAPALSAQASATVIRNALLVDGTGAPARAGAVRVAGGRITEVGDVVITTGDRVIDARGLVLAPGFIDTHSHHDRGLGDDPAARAAVSQGITTIIVGQDGGSWHPLAEAMASAASQRFAVNVATYSGHNTLRRVVMGDDFRRPATAAEVDAMVALLRQDMEAGALGLSTGLEYDPGIYAETAEVVALAREAARHGGRYISHLRSEDRALWDAVAELLEIGRLARIPVQHTHAKLAAKSLWGEAPRLLALLDSARAAGVDVTLDVYPYTFWQSTLTVLFPERDFEDRAAAEFALAELAPADGLRLTAFGPEPSYVGRTIAEIARLRDADEATTLMALIREARAWSASAGGGAGESVMGTSMHESDIEALLRWPHASVSSDGALRDRHPRGAGAFPRVLGEYVRERRVLSLEEAVRRMTSQAAANVGLQGRGVLAPGAAADLVLFDPATVADRATVASPGAAAVGIEAVWVGGEVVWQSGQATGALPGRMLRRAQP